MRADAPPPGPGPDREAALAQYRRRARRYDSELTAFEPIRRLAVSRLALQRGDVVVDAGCGTGLSLALLRAAVGPRGRVIGIEQSPEMITLARRRVADNRWRNVDLVCAPMETARVARRADAALLHFTHDILCRPEAIAQVLRCLRPGARVVAAGLKWSQVWPLPGNLFVLAAALYSVTSLDGLDRPWRLLAPWLEGLSVESLWLDTLFVAHGTLPAGLDGSA